MRILPPHDMATPINDDVETLPRADTMVSMRWL